MTLWHGADEVELLWYGGDEVDVAWYGADEVFPPGTTPAPVTDVQRSNTINVQTSRGGIGGTFTLRGRRQAVNLQWLVDRNLVGVITGTSDLAAAVAAWRELELELAYTDGVLAVSESVNYNGYWNVAGDSIIFTMPDGSIRGRDAFTGSTNGWMRLVSTRSAPAPDPDPTPSDHLLEETLAAVAIGGSGAAGRFGGLTWQFTHSGRTYNITHCFTHTNGIQLRFGSAAEAQAFIAAGFTVDSGITGQDTFKSSVMDNIFNPAIGAQYRTFAGRYAAGTSYTVTISE